MGLFEKGNYFPPENHQERIDRYKENKKLVKGDHWEVFKGANSTKNSKLYVSANLAGIIAKKSADFLIGDGVQVSAGREDNSSEQKALDRLMEDNDLDILFYESALSNAYRGDSFFRVRFGQKFNGAYPEFIDEKRVIIETVNAENVFPEVSAYNNNFIETYHVAVPQRVGEAKAVDAPNNYILNVETHRAGSITYSKYAMTCTMTDIYGSPVSYKIGDLIEEPVTVQTGVPLPLIVHVANFSLDDTWEGLDDLTELKPLFDELNNRLSQVASILDKHANPALALPMGLMVEDSQGRPMFNVADSKVFELDDKDRMPQYITWNGQLLECYSEIDRITDLILMTAEIPAVALGSGDSGTSGSSGLSIRFRLNSLISKIKRKRKYYEKGLKQIFYIAQLLEQAFRVDSYEVVKPKFIFTDGLDEDEVSKANMMAVRTGGAITMSQKRAIMLLDGLTEEQAEAEIQRIEEEQKSKAPAIASPSIFNDDYEDIYDEDEGTEETTEEDSEDAKDE
ncbi:phage portal protein [Rummeliibacillus stabekisii]|uniref:phage portal protein n=1 Tax=Rummeliibacillus stabekisii TaxID=241244 RepID=UPI003723B681